MPWSASELSLLFSIGSLAAFSSLWVAGRIWPTRQTSSGSGPNAPHVFTFCNRELIAASPAAQRALNIEDLDEDIFNQLFERLQSVFPTLTQDLQAAQKNRRDLHLEDVTKTGPVSIDIAFRDDRVQVVVQGIPAPLSRKLIVDEDYANAAEVELRVLRDTVEASPVPTWRENAKGQIDWVNRAYIDLLESSECDDGASTWPPQRLFESSTIVHPGATPKTRRSSLLTPTGVKSWFDVASFGQRDHSLHFACDANALVNAETSLRNFMQTLTQTFAYLPIGLAIFDSNRQLVVFNPALTDLTSLKPEWLSIRPTLHDFLNRLREERMLPERRNFSDWRQKIDQLEASARDGTYSEAWTLPTGQTYRITGRPHPEGAIAFLFEDITAEISLTRKFRQELELSQTLFDSFPQAMAVFGADGIIKMSNLSYSNLWGIDPGDALGQITIIDATRLWQDLCEPTPLWGDARDFVSRIGDRSEWNGTVRLCTGKDLSCRFVPMAGGTTLAEFSGAATMPHHRHDPDRTAELSR
ncbi:MAG: diguanylate cyclase [Litoreibacter sp.]|nr:diguanylate cyclase [Litoreibacter sp.]